MYYENYAKIRDAKGLTDYAVSRATGVSTATMTNWKQTMQPGQGYTPKLDKLLAIARFLEVPLDELIAEADHASH